MQYLLSEEEYQELVGRGAQAVHEQRTLVESLCVQVANATLIEYTHLDEPLPHGCVHNNNLIHDKLDDSGLAYESKEWNDLEEKLEAIHPLQEHCDDCPVRKVCTLDHSISK